MGLHVKVFSVAKAGNRPEEYEDAYAYSETEKRLAIADGATDAFESRLWAQALVKTFASEHLGGDVESMLRWLGAPTHWWRENIHWDQLSWYSGEKARRGAFATFLGVTFDWPATDCMEEGCSSYQWRAVAVGDSCLFLVRGDEVVVRFPIERAEEFGPTPPLVSTQADYNGRSLEELRSCTGECRSTDLLVLATDALAAWFLGQVEAGKQPWERLVALQSQEEFEELVETLRRNKEMRNDDVTLLLASIEREGVEATPSREDAP